MRRISEATCDTLAEIHNLDWKAAGLGDLGKPEGYVERQVRGWADRYAQGAHRRRAHGRPAGRVARGEPSCRRAARHARPQRLQVRQRRPRPGPLAGHRGARLGDGHHRRSAHGPRDGPRILDRAGRPARLPGHGLRARRTAPGTSRGWSSSSAGRGPPGATRRTSSSTTRSPSSSSRSSRSSSTSATSTGSRRKTRYVRHARRGAGASRRRRSWPSTRAESTAWASELISAALGALPASLRPSLPSRVVVDPHASRHEEAQQERAAATKPPTCAMNATPPCALFISASERFTRKTRR